MTALKQQAISIIESLPEEKILLLLNFLNELDEQTEKHQRLAKKAAAFELLESLRVDAPSLDYDRELAEYRKERFAGNENLA